MATTKTSWQRWRWGVGAWMKSRRVRFFFFQAEDGIRDLTVTGVQTCALPICLGPTTAPALAADLSVPPARVEAALAVLQAEGFAMRGAFTAEAPAATEWCERRLLARIHRYTVRRLRAEIEPIEGRDFLRFLIEWQRVTLSGRMEGPDAVGAVPAQLEGFEAPASAWSTEILPNRIGEHAPARLDEAGLAGLFGWPRAS